MVPKAVSLLWEAQLAKILAAERQARNVGPNTAHSTIIAQAGLLQCELRYFAFFSAFYLGGLFSPSCDTMLTRHPSREQTSYTSLSSHKIPTKVVGKGGGEQVAKRLPWCYHSCLKHLFTHVLASLERGAPSRGGGENRGGERWLDP